MKFYGARSSAADFSTFRLHRNMLTTKTLSFSGTKSNNIMDCLFERYARVVSLSKIFISRSRPEKIHRTRVRPYRFHCPPSPIGHVRARFRDCPPPSPILTATCKRDAHERPPPDGRIGGPHGPGTRGPRRRDDTTVLDRSGTRAPRPSRTAD